MMMMMMMIMISIHLVRGLEFFRGRVIGPPPAVHRLGGLMLRHFIPHGRRRVVEHGRVETNFHILLIY